jgi:hypothetical protein
MGLRLMASMALSVFSRCLAMVPPCRSGCVCDQGTVKNVPDIWPNSTTAPINTDLTTWTAPIDIDTS